MHNHRSDLLEYCIANEIKLANTIYEHTDIYSFKSYVLSRNENWLYKSPERRLKSSVARVADKGSGYYLNVTKLNEYWEYKSITKTKIY